MAKTNIVGTVACRYTNIAGSSVGTSATQIPWATKDYDTHSAMAANGTFTAPISGKYSVKVFLTMAILTLSGSQVIEVQLYKNGSFYSELAWLTGTGSGLPYRLGGNEDINLLAGETVSIIAVCSIAANLTTVAGYTHVAISRIGN